MLPNKKIIDELKKLAIKAKNNNEVPISAIIAKKNKIFFSAYNTCHKTNNPLNHAEMIIISKALKKTTGPQTSKTTVKKTQKTKKVSKK